MADTLQQKTYIGWIDLLRIFACFMVLISHSCDAFVSTFDNSIDFQTGVFFGSLVRACVPLFAMMSGILLFPIKADTSTFYKKRIGRLLLPLVFWSLALPLCFYLYLNYIHTSNAALIDMENYTFSETCKRMLTFVFNFNYDTTPLWYIYMLVGLYLALPIFSAWAEKASKKDLQVFLGIWGFTLCLPYIQLLAPALGYQGNYDHFGLYGVSHWNEFGTFYYFAGFIGYIVLAYYLIKYPLNWHLSKTLTVATVLFVTGFLITFFGFLKTHEYDPGNYAALEIIWYFCNINVAMMTFALFFAFQKIAISSSHWLRKCSAYTFGIYLCHFIVVQAFSDFFVLQTALPAAVKILLIAVLSFGLSYVATAVFDSNKWTRKLVM